MRGLPGLRMDYATITRLVSTSDDEGNSVTAALTLFGGRCTWSENGAMAAEKTAGRPFAIRQATLELRSPVVVLESDIVEVQGTIWSVVAVQPIRTHTRLQLQAPAPKPYV